MMRSMFSGVSGLRVHQTKMDVIANNIANVNTNGYKSSRVTFSEIFSQTISGTSGANPEAGRGGVNAMQIGLGANVASIDMLMTTGAAQRTDNPFDLMIQGDGFFIVKDSAGTYFTRAGAFRQDAEGNVVNPSGLQLQGFKATLDTKTGKYDVYNRSELKPIQITGEDEYIPPKVTTKVNMEGNLNADTDPIKTTSISFFDSDGNKYAIDVQMTYNQTNKNWEVRYGDRMYLNGDTKNPIPIDYTFTAPTGPVPDPYDPTKNTYPATIAIQTRPTTGAALPVDTEFQPATGAIPIQFTTDGVMNLNATGGNPWNTPPAVPPVAPTVPAGIADIFNLTITDTGVRLSPNATFGAINGATAPIKVDFRGMTQFGNTKADATSTTVDGNAPGRLSGLSIGSDGKITGRYSNGQVKVLWQLSIATFKNPAGLERNGDNLYVETNNSGQFDGVGEPPGGGMSIIAGVLEMSNVDLAQEFTEMITTQRGFQANSRTITTSDEMLQELVNLKR